MNSVHFVFNNVHDNCSVLCIGNAILCSIISSIYLLIAVEYLSGNVLLSRWFEVVVLV